jgi:division protein CdvB (Snf7/Vps24/ESCRT-III family)
MSKFTKSWEEPKTGIRSLIKPDVPLRQKIELAARRVEAQIQYLNGAIQLLTERDKALFKKVVDAYSKHDMQRASVYANELAEIRKMTNFIMNSELALERVALRLRTVTQLGSVAAALAPVSKVLQSIRVGVAGIFPGAEREMSEISMLLDEIVIEASQTTGISPDFEVASEEAQKILNEAAMVAEQRMKEKFPELPTLKATSEELGEIK